MTERWSRRQRLIWRLDDCVSVPIERLAWKVAGRSCKRYDDQYWREQGIDPDEGRRARHEKFRADLERTREDMRQTIERLGAISNRFEEKPSE